MRQALGALAGLLPVGILAVDGDGHAWYASQRWIDLCGATGGNGLPWYAAIHPDDRRAVAERWRTRVERRGNLGVFRAVGPDGAIRSCRAEAVTMVGEDGDADGHLIVVADATPPDGRDAENGSSDGVTGALSAWGALATPHLLDVVLDRSQDVITILNPDGSWRWSNGGTIRLVGHQENFRPADGIFSLLHPDDVAHGRRVLGRALAGHIDREEKVEVRIRAADGSWRWMEGSLDVLLDDPSVRGIVVHLHDITERRRVHDELEAAHRRLVDLIENMQAAVVLQDEQGRVVLANQRFAELFRLAVPTGELVGKTLPSIGLSASKVVAEPSDASRQLQLLRASGLRREGVRAVLFDGRTLECDFVPLVVQGAHRGYLSMYRDVTGQARAEAERDRLLASEREENRRLAELDVYRSESIAAVSHELRTPLTSLVGYTQLLRGSLDPSTSSEEVAYLDAIARNVDRLLRLAGDVVALDSLESRAMPLPIAPVDVCETVARAVQTIRPEASARSIAVLTETRRGPIVQGDEDRLGQLFENLLSNAVKFTLPEGRIVVRARPLREATPRDAGEEGAQAASAPRAREPVWEVTIEDSGIGIPEDEVAMISTRFFRASNARRRGLPGSGLGMSVARAIAERHGGSVSVSSVVGVGTTVTVQIGDVVDEGPTPFASDGPDATQASDPGGRLAPDPDGRAPTRSHSATN